MYNLRTLFSTYIAVAPPSKGRSHLITMTEPNLNFTCQSFAHGKGGCYDCPQFDNFIKDEILLNVLKSCLISVIPWTIICTVVFQVAKVSLLFLHSPVLVLVFPFQISL